MREGGGELIYSRTHEKRNKEVKLINVSRLFCQDAQLLNGPGFELYVVLLNIKPFHAVRISTCCLYFGHKVLPEDFCTSSAQSHTYTHLPVLLGLQKKKKLLLIIYSPPYHPRCPCHSFFSQKEIKVFDENIPGFFSI